MNFPLNFATLFAIRAFSFRSSISALFPHIVPISTFSGRLKEGAGGKVCGGKGGKKNSRVTEKFIYFHPGELLTPARPTAFVRQSGVFQSHSYPQFVLPPPSPHFRPSNTTPRWAKPSGFLEIICAD